MKNIKTLFLLSFFGCFILPMLIVLFATFSIFFKIDFIIYFSNWILVSGGIWIIIIYEIIIILITLLLGLTLKLKDVEFITTERVIKGKKSEVIVKKVNAIDLKSETKVDKRKEVKAPEKRDIYFEDDDMVQEIKQIEKKIKPSVEKPIQSTPTTQTQTTAQATKPKPIMPIKK